MALKILKTAETKYWTEQHIEKMPLVDCLKSLDPKAHVQIYVWGEFFREGTAEKLALNDDVVNPPLVADEVRIYKDGTIAVFA